MTPCNLNQLTQPRNQTSSGISPDNAVFDRESGRPIVIYHSFDSITSDPLLPFGSERQSLSPEKLVLLLKCMLIIRDLPKAALKETAEELDGIYHFHINRRSQSNLSTISASTIQGKLGAAQVRQPIVLD